MDLNSQFNYCANCSSDLSTDLSNRKFATFHELAMDQQAQDILTPIKIHSVLSSIYKLNYFDALKFVHVHEDPLILTNDEQVGLCQDCYNVLVNLYKFYFQFNQLRLQDSYLSNAISKLDNLMFRIESIVNNFSEESTNLPNLHIKNEESLIDEDSDDSYLEQDVASTVKCELEDQDEGMEAELESDSRNKILSNKLNPTVSLRRLQHLQVESTTNRNQSSKEESEDDTYNEYSSDNLNEDNCTHQQILDSLTQPSKSRIKRRRKAAKNFSQVPSATPQYSKKSRTSCSSSESRKEKKVKIYMKLTQPSEIIVNNICPFCQKKFMAAFNLKKHLLTHLQDSSNFICPLPNCSKKFSCERSLFTHFRCHEDTQHHCPVPNCSKSFGRKSRIQKHLEIHWKQGIYVCFKCTDSFSSQQTLQTHIATSHQVKYECPSSNCSQNFKTELKLVAHLRKDHPNEKLYGCTKCLATFPLNRLLLHHMEYAHQEGGYSCDLCCAPRKYKTQERLKKHQENCKGQQIFNCSVCSKSFKEKYRFENHEKIHSGEGRSWKCTFEGCTKSFFLPSVLKRHLATHRDERPYICSQCGFSFKFANKLTLHMFTHNTTRNFLCSECGKAFSTVELLKKHNRVHTNSKNFPCSDCDKVFKYSESRTLHFRTHHTPGFICPICGAGFPYNFNLKKHMANVHDSKE